ncbi:MAG: HAD family hydrolase [Clostridia bacterium]|nr:HAD family hydrolase [Clostridia bacterium]
MKYKCLVLDHDDTVVNSTATIHYPCFIEFLGIYYPELVKNYTLESYFVKNFHPGVSSLFLDEIGMTEEEFVAEQKYWENYVKGHVPSAYEGIGDIIRDFRNTGGIIAVDSHSMTAYIERDFKQNSLPSPDVIYGWDIPKEKRKPAPDTLFDLMERYSLSPREVLVVDDLKPGYDMARAAGVDFAAAGWAYDVEEIRAFMKKNCDFYLESVSDLRALLFEA